MKRHVKAALGALAVALICAGTASGDEQPPAREPDIVGTINEVQQGRITIGTGKKAVARLTQNTRILTERPLRKRLESGMRVNVWLEGPGSDAALVIQIVQLPGRPIGQPPKR